tara:strand:- start:198 stop:509 length:312 start_codon:yes stop_codon:yes gene_type:complete
MLGVNTEGKTGDDLTFIGVNIYDKWKVRVLYKKQLSENPDDFKITYRFIYPFMSGYYRGKWTYHPANISEEEQEVQKFCKKTWTDSFKEGYKRWRESVGPWVE